MSKIFIGNSETMQGRIFMGYSKKNAKTYISYVHIYSHHAQNLKLMEGIQSEITPITLLQLLLPYLLNYT